MASLAVAPTVSVDEYLHSVYEPDMDLVDGVLEDRNVGEFDHWRIQRALLEALAKGEKLGGYFVVQVELACESLQIAFAFPTPA